MNSCGRLCLASLLGLGLTILVGCGSGANSKIGNVEGTIKVNGVNANSGNINFTGADGTTIGAAIQADGTYRAIGVGVGEAKVTVTGAPPPVKGNAPLPVTKDSGMGGTAPVGNPIPIPAKFGKAETSGLSTPVKNGTNTYSPDLK
jgi:hypothetical protein